MNRAKLDRRALLNDSRLSAEWSGSGQMQRLVLELLLDHYEAGQIPTNGRFLFYELEQRGHVRKSGPNDKGRYGRNGVLPREQNVINAHSELRKRGIIPWAWIIDETRHLSDWDYADTVAEYVRNAVDWARINPWPGEPPAILVESRSLGGVLRDLAGDYLCPIAPTNVQVGGFLHTDVVPILVDNDRPVKYIGDWDISGHQIENNTKAVLEKESGRTIEWTRIAITEEQIEERGIEPAWKTDDRYDPPKTHYAWEAEALGQGEIVSLVREALDELLLPKRLEDMREREQRQRERVAEVLDSLNLEDE
jgi:hypothetical protein